MGRYQIAKNSIKTPEELKAVKPPDRVESFGFGNDDSLSDIRLRPLKSFYCEPGEKNRVGIIFNDTSTMFVGAKTHFHNKHFFLCKGGRCCSQERKPAWRIACAIYVVRPNGEGPKIYPWVFGRGIYKKLQEANKFAPISEHDFILTRKREQFDPWDIMYSDLDSMWQRPENKDRILMDAQRVIKGLKNCLGQDLDEAQILELLLQPSEQPSRHIYGFDRGAVNRNGRYYPPETYAAPQLGTGHLSMGAVDTPQSIYPVSYRRLDTEPEPPEPEPAPEPTQHINYRLVLDAEPEPSGPGRPESEPEQEHPEQERQVSPPSQNLMIDHMMNDLFRDIE